LAWLERTANEKKHETTMMVPNRVFLEEIRHLQRVPELSEPAVPRTALIRPTNVVHYRRNRYEVPLGTYQPGRQSRIEPEGKTVRFYDVTTGELFAEHEIYDGKGKLVQLPKNGERFRSNKYTGLKEAVLSGFTGCEGGDVFVEAIIKKYPRYVRDQLSLIQKQQKKCGSAELSRALSYCIERELFSANDFRDTLEYFRVAQPLPQIRAVKLDVKYAVVTAHIRDVSVYTAISQGGENYAH